MAWERNNAAEEFETMLRRHLAQGAGRSAVSCEGLDIERANAYVEDALSTAVRLRYEDHLAGCHPCRRAVIELRRMMPEVEVAAAPVRTPNRFAEWWAGVRQGFAASPWRWGTAAAAGAFAVLLAVVLIPRRQYDMTPSPSASQIAAIPAATPAIQAGDVVMGGAPAASANAQTSIAQQGQQGQNQSELARTASATSPTGRPSLPLARGVAGGASVAAVPVLQTAETTRTDFAMRAPGTIIGRVSNPAGGVVAEAQVALVDTTTAQPRAVTKTGSDGQFRFTDVPGGNYNLTVQANGFQSQSIANVRPEVGQEIAVRLDSGDSGRPMVAANTSPAPTSVPAPPPPAPGAKVETEAAKAERETVAQNKPEERPAADKAADKTEGKNERSQPSTGSAGFVPRSRSAKNTKKSTSNQATGDDETVKPMTRKVHDKTFRFENGRWIDVMFKPEFLPPRTRVERNSAEYERVLAENPELKPFFELGRVIVVWRNKVFEVR